MRKIVLLAAVTGLCLYGTAAGAFDTSDAYTDGGGTTWAGTATMTNGNLSADIEWCVNNRVLHGGELQFEYLYQISATGSLPITKLSVGMLESNEAEDIGYFQIDPTDIAPTDAFFGGMPPNLDSANWTFSGLTDGDVSYTLNYWSVNEPRYGPASLHDGGVIAGGVVPSPSDVIPEPGTVSLLVVGGILIAIRKRRR